MSSLLSSRKPQLAPPWGIPAAPPVHAPSLPLPWCSMARLCLPPTHMWTHPFNAGRHFQQIKNNNKKKKKNNNNLRVVGKAPCTALTWLQIHIATGTNNANPWAGRCRCIFTAGVDAAERERQRGNTQGENSEVRVKPVGPSDSLRS